MRSNKNNVHLSRNSVRPRWNNIRSGVVSVSVEVRWVVLVESGVVSAPAKVRWAILVKRLGRYNNRNNDKSGNKSSDRSGT